MSEGNEEQFMQRRLLLASVLSAVAIMGYVYVASLTAPSGPPSEDSAAVEQTATGEPTAVGQPAEEASGSQTAPTEPDRAATEEPNGQADASIASDSEHETVLESETYRVTFSNRGAVVKSWILKDYDDSSGEPLELVHPAGAQKYGYPFELASPGGEALKTLNEGLFVLEGGTGVLTAPAALAFEYAQGGWRARKTFRFEPQGYLLRVETEVRQNGEPQPHLLTWPGGFGDTGQTNDALYSQTFYYDPASAKPVRNAAADAVDQRISNTGPYPFAGLDDLFFAAVFTPDNDPALTLETWAIQLVPEEGAAEATFAAAAVGGSGENRFEVYLGPKSIPILASINPRLRQIVDFGWLSFLAVPLFYMLEWTHANLIANYGWAIVLVTIAINFVLFPLKWKSTKSMKRMQALQPLIKQINEKYKGLSMRDPKKAQQNEEMMALYKKYGVNPMGGCLPMVLQLPFFISFYYVLTSAIEMRHAEWLWVADLSRPEQIPIRVLPLAMVISQFWQQSITPQPTVDPAQARLMKFMPLLFGFFFYGFQSGLVLYWLTMNLVGVGQQVLLNRLPAEPLDVEQPRRRKKKK
jgi:YidC/Oxa1 family membrane protein insertase